MIRLLRQHKQRLFKALRFHLDRLLHLLFFVYHLLDNLFTQNAIQIQL